MMMMMMIDWTMTSITKIWDPVDVLVSVGRPGLCRRSNASVTHPSADTGTSDLPHPSVHVELKLNKQKTKILRINASTNKLVTLEEEEQKEDESFTNLGSVVDK